MKQSQQHHRSLKYEFDTMVKVDKHLKNKISDTVEKMYVNKVMQGNLGFRNWTTLKIMHHLFDTHSFSALNKK